MLGSRKNSKPDPYPNTPCLPCIPSPMLLSYLRIAKQSEGQERSLGVRPLFLNHRSVCNIKGTEIQQQFQCPLLSNYFRRMATAVNWRSAFRLPRYFVPTNRMESNNLNGRIRTMAFLGLYGNLFNIISYRLIGKVGRPIYIPLAPM
jgi:hypothetical protein